MKLRFLCLLSSVGSLAVTTPLHADLLAVSYSGQPAALNVFNIDEATGNGSTIGASGVVLLNNLAGGRDGAFWSTGLVPGDLQHDWLIRINPLTGVGTPTAILNFGGVDHEAVDALAVSPAGELFGVSLNDSLFRIDVHTGVGTSVGRIGVPGSPIGVNALAFAPDGTLYGWGVERYGLIQIDPATAAFTDVSSSFGGGPQVQGMTFGADGTLYGARDVLFRINPNNGSLIQIGPGDGFQDVRGIAVIPEPTVLALAGMGLALGLARGRVSQRPDC